jgi:hypothetical protein
MTVGVARLLSRASSIIRREGPRELLRRGIETYVFRHENRYVYEHTLLERNETDFLPRTEDYILRIVANNSEADRLASETGFDFRTRFSHARASLSNGAIAFCVFVGGKFAHIGWAALDEEGKNCFEPLPYRVDFANSQACTGGTWTEPEFRGLGLMAYGYFERFRFLREKGCTTSRNVVAVGNTISHRVHAKFGPRVCAKARQIKVLWWEWWKEVPVVESDPHPQPGSVSS